MTLLTSTVQNQHLGELGAVLLFVVLAGCVLLVIGAFFSALFSPASVGMKLVWIVFIVIAPFIGSLFWFMIGKRNAQLSAFG
ncbi:hypothetical protein E0H73_28945 [Kribbella pittospori]|uniref:Cardiolipin synthase N-terminal domain-containing protein n=1 Tax=Kribbella pittospori TaxID=722689 RepID=A0A4R0KAW0_9ACTN|nr:PLDc N-terminal domain-containing protein [Kribbella pittospori]TCC57421.1 hypothetical protein E0H73_28945 [Kribbella pittospori]